MKALVAAMRSWAKSDSVKKERTVPERSGEHKTLVVETYTAGRMGPGEPMLGPINVGDTIRAITAPGCCGPLITTHFRGAHEVTTPVEISGAEIGDAIVLRINRVDVTAAAAASGVSYKQDGRFAETGQRRCQACGTTSPKSVVEGIGPACIRCAECGAEITPIGFHEGYTAVFNEQHTVGVGNVLVLSRLTFCN